MIKKMWNAEKRAIVFFTALLILMFLLLSAGKSGRYERTFGTDELLLNAGTSSVSAESGYAGLLTSGPAVSLPAGDYEITVRYRAEADGSFIQLWTAHDNPANGHVVWDGNGELPASQSERTFFVTLQGNISGLEVCTFYSGNGSFSIQNMTIRCVSGAANVKDHLILPALLWIAMLVWYIGYRHLEPNMARGMIFVTFAVVVVSMPCYLPYLVSGHDMPFEINRIIGIANGLRSGQFPVRIHTSTYEGYGYAASVFYPELFLYIPAILYGMGLSLVSSVHVYLILIHALSAMSMFFAASRMTRSVRTAALSAILFTCASYRLVLAYLMNGYGSAMAMAWIPLVIYGFYEIMLGDRRKWIYLLIGMSGVLQSHILSFMIVTVFLCAVFFVCLFRVHCMGRYIALLKSAIGTALLNAWFLVPFFQFYFSDIQTESLAGNPAGRALSLVNLLSVWGHAGTGIQVTDQPAVGVPALIDLSILIGIVCFAALSGTHEKEIGMRAARARRIAAVLLIAGTAAVYMTTKYFPWGGVQKLPVIGRFAQFLQHPQRILCVAVPCLCIAAACGYVGYCGSRRALVPAVCAAALLTSGVLLQEYATRPVVCRKGEIMASYAETEEYLYPGTQTDSLDAARYAVSSEAVSLALLTRKENNITVQASAAEDGYVEFPLFFYPGYRASINGEARVIERGENNVIRVWLREGDSGELRVYYQGNILWRLADWVSVLTLLGYPVCKIAAGKKKERAGQP